MQLQTILEAIQKSLADFYLFFYSKTDNYWLALIIYVAIVSLLFNFFALPEYMRSNYSSYFKKKKKIIEQNNPKDYYAYKEQVAAMKKAEKYHPTWYIGLILFALEYGMYILIFYVIRNPLRYFSGLSAGELSTVKHFFSNRSIEGDFKILENISKMPSYLLSPEAMKKLMIFSDKFKIFGNSLASRPLSLSAQGSKNWWILPLIIIVLCLAQIAFRFFLKRKSLPEMSTDRKLIFITLTVFPLLASYSTSCLVFTQYIEIYFITLVLMNTLRISIYRKLLPQDKVVNFIYKLKKINKEDIICPELTTKASRKTPESLTTE